MGGAATKNAKTFSLVLNTLNLQGGFQTPDTKLSRKGASLSMFDNLSIKTSIEILLVQKTVF